jgi:hypothetical protein
LLLDNSGHSGDGRARGTSSKGDLLEVLFTLDVVQPFSMETSGQLKLSLEPGSSRHGNEGQWIMTLGGGKFGEWVSQPASGERIKAKAKSLSEGERQVLDHLREHAGDSQTATVKALLGGGVGRNKLERAVKDLLAGRRVEQDEEGGLRVASASSRRRKPKAAR